MITTYHFLLDHRVGGPHVYVKNIAKELITYIKTVIVSTGKGSVTDISLINLRHTSRWLYPFEIIANVLLIIWLVRAQKIEKNSIFCVHGSANIAPIIAAWFLSQRTIWYIHETLNNFKLLTKVGKYFIHHGNNRIVVVANRAKKTYQLNDAIYIPSGIDFKFWVNTNQKKIVNTNLHLLTIGNINPLKGFDVLIDALVNLKTSFQLKIIGAQLETHADYFTYIKEQAIKISTPDREVIFLGWQSDFQIKALFESTDIYILSSRSEACPISLLEAMASGCACIATDVGDVAQIISHEQSGIVVAPENPEEILRAINLMIELGSENRYIMGKLAKNSIKENFSIANLAKQHLMLYQDICKF